jgi:hypothetical protein
MVSKLSEDCVAAHLPEIKSIPPHRPEISLSLGAAEFRETPQDNAYVGDFWRGKLGKTIIGRCMGPRGLQ